MLLISDDEQQQVYDKPHKHILRNYYCLDTLVTNINRTHLNKSLVLLKHFDKKSSPQRHLKDNNVWSSLTAFKVIGFGVSLFRLTVSLWEFSVVQLMIYITTAFLLYIISSHQMFKSYTLPMCSSTKRWSWLSCFFSIFWLSFMQKSDIDLPVL